MHQPIIPGLPDDLALRCLAMLSHGYHGVMEAVSKRWRDVMHSEEYSNFKAREGWSGDWLFVLTETNLGQWIAYDPEADRWHPIALTPRSQYDRRGPGICCVCVHNKFLVTGGTYRILDKGYLVSDEVLQFDLFKKKWSTAASVRTPRMRFASCTMDGKVDVAGGCNSDYLYLGGMNLAEVYDPLTDKWEDLPPMPVPMTSCIGMAYKGKFHVINVHEDNQDLYQTAVFDPSSRSWHIKHESWSLRPKQVALIDDQVYTIISEIGGSRVERRDAEKDEWHIVGEVPPVFDPNDSKGVCYNKLAALGNELYVMGGMSFTMKDSEIENILVDLDRVKVCDPGCLPLIWRETRPMCLNASGFITGCASLKQQQ